MFISMKKTKVITFRRCNTVWAKVIIQEHTIEHTTIFLYLVHTLSYIKTDEIGVRPCKIQYICCTTKTTKIYKDTLFKCYKAMTVTLLALSLNTLKGCPVRGIKREEMKFLWSIVGWTLRGNKRSGDKTDKTYLIWMTKLRQIQKIWNIT